MLSEIKYCLNNDAIQGFQVKYQTREIVFHHISKHQEESSKYDAQRVYLTKFEVFGNVMKHCLECLIISIETKTKE